MEKKHLWEHLLSSRRSTTSTTESTTAKNTHVSTFSLFSPSPTSPQKERWRHIQLRLELSSLSVFTTTLLISESPSVSTLSVTPLTTTAPATGPSIAITAQHSPGGCVATVLLNVGGWDNFRREMEPFAKVV